MQNSFPAILSLSLPLSIVCIYLHQKNIENFADSLGMWMKNVAIFFNESER